MIGDLCDLAESYLEPDQVKEIYRAYLYGAEAHEGQKRASGEPYIYHPLQVARTLTEMRLDHETIVAAILHDVIEDTPTLKEQIAQEFGAGVAELVDGVSKLAKLPLDSKAEAQAQNYQKMLLAMARDIRVILVKLADRLHNMRTLEPLRLEKRRRIARETLDIYAPIANRLGLHNIRLELENLGFQALYPLRYAVLAGEVRRARGHRKQVIKRIETALKRRLRQEELVGEVVGREKHLYSLYLKMRGKRVSFSEVLDVYAFRILVDSVDMCYRVLGCVHNLYKPVPGRFKDYIAIPKANGYQSLHTVLFGPYSVPIEIQVRTEEMHAVAESGIAAHWAYKSGEAGVSVAQKRANLWLRELLEMQKTAGNSVEFIENVKVDLFPDEVYVFTPAGEIMEFTRGATAVDFAYGVHTDVGNTCVAVKIDRRYAPLRSKLETGQTVEVITAPWAKPNPTWLNFVVTGKARANIRNYLKNLQSNEAIELGRRLLTQALIGESTTIDEVSDEAYSKVLAEIDVAEFDDLLRDIGLGQRLAPLIAKRLSTILSDDEPEAQSDETRTETHGAPPLYIKGTEGMVVSFARCCRPLPGDPIFGFVSSGRGLVIHTQSCANLADLMSRPENCIDVDWEKNVERDFTVEIKVEVTNQKGILATVAAAISELNVNIVNVNIDERDGVFSSLLFTIDVADRTHLARVIRRLRSVPLVSRIVRL
ncbi:MAG: bifunctional GTP diphosphokinase/guanosine-3',5'-bis pyrophosphate 3'-pyrophosphohydrolase [Gammaproteobacteria bacterium]|nr:bifunctional GTP diphosphokinase/guanosine-3',5'-bis pyrophosphate 3'-pyrophosphohydrolase [Gammaproteobacteria bacterium]